MSPQVSGLKSQVSPPSLAQLGRFATFAYRTMSVMPGSGWPK